MAWDKFNPNLAAHDLVQDMKWKPEIRKEFKENEKAVLDRYALLPEERKTIEERDFRTLYDLGMHPYLGGQLSRFIWGNDAGKSNANCDGCGEVLLRNLAFSFDPTQRGWMSMDTYVPAIPIGAVMRAAAVSQIVE